MVNVNECFKCGVSGEKVRLYDVISNTGIVKICAECNAEERFPIIRKPTTDQIADSQRQQSVREMLRGAEKSRLMAGREPTLRELVDRNLKERLSRQPSDLIDNFQWIIQRTRRNRKITREQFAKGIGESEASVRMLESGVLPNNDYRIITKTENFLGINLKKQGVSSFSEKREPPKHLGFDRESRESIEGLKIEDLREMKKKKQEAEKAKPIEWEGETSQDDEKFLDEALNDESLFDDEEK